MVRRAISKWLGSNDLKIAKGKEADLKMGMCIWDNGLAKIRFVRGNFGFSGFKRKFSDSWLPGNEIREGKGGVGRGFDPEFWKIDIYYFSFEASMRK
jgi:hypothetical protein